MLNGSRQAPTHRKQDLELEWIARLRRSKSAILADEPVPVVPGYPRGCGQHGLQDVGSVMTRESSPHVRGALPRVHGGRTGPGTIPTGTGSTPPVLTTSMWHEGSSPQVRGATDRGGRAVRGEGSSPQVRGAHGQRARAHVAVGITPVGAGSTAHKSKEASALTDHPRGCGEHQLPSGVWVQLGGIIPAVAGSTSRRACSRRRGADHPRGCGEHTEAAAGKTYDAGSSPRVRGARADE